MPLLDSFTVDHTIMNAPAVRIAKTMATPSLNRDVNYLSKDFDSLKSDLMDYVKRQFPNEWRDFNDASGGNGCSRINGLRWRYVKF